MTYSREQLSYLESVAANAMRLIKHRSDKARRRLEAGVLNPFTRKPYGPGELIVDVPKGASQLQLSKLQELVEGELPEDLAMWLRLTNGPAGFFGIESPREEDDILLILKKYPDWGTRGLIPVARDSNGCFYAQSTAHHSSLGCPVVFMDLPDNGSTPRYLCASNMIKFAEFKVREYCIAEPELSGEIKKWPVDRDFMMREDPALFGVSGLPYFSDQ